MVWTPGKWAGFSRTIVGGVMMAVSLAISLGVQLDGEDVNSIRVAIEGALGTIGLVLVVYGRLRAKSNLYVNPFGK